jgi:dienelactone hydrolase
MLALLWACGSSSGPVANDATGEAFQGDAEEAGPDATGDAEAETGDAAEEVVDAPVEATDLPPDAPAWPEKAEHVVFDWNADPVALPFPSDHHRDPSDGHLVLDDGDHASALLPLVYTDTAMQKAMAVFKGWAPYAPVMFLSSVPLEPASMPADIAGSIADGASIRILRVDGGVPEAAAFVVRYREFEEDGDNHYLVTLLPARPLIQGGRYLLVVTDGLKSKEGVALGRARGFAACMGETDLEVAAPERAVMAAAQQARLAPLVKALPEAAHVIAAIDFTIGSEGAETKAIFDRLGKGADMAIPYTTDADGNGSPDMFDGPSFADCTMDAGALGYGVHGTFQPWNLTGEDGHFHATADGWETFAQAPVEYWLMVPPGAGPHPVVILGHGISSDHHQLCAISRELVAAGMATWRFDFPRHGPRGSGGMDFLSIGDPLRIRDNFRQAAIDIASAVVVIEGLAKDLDHLPAGAPDGNGDLDAGRIGYLGHSLGGIIGMLHFAFSDRVKVMVSNEGGLGIYHLAESYLFDMLPAVYNAIGLTNLAEHILWTGDGISFARQVFDEPLSAAHQGKRLLAQELIGDKTVSNVSTEVLARGVGLTLAEPFHVAVDGMATAPAATLHSALFQFQAPEAIHSDFTHSPLTPLAAKMHQQAVRYLQSYFATGETELTVP